MATRHKRSRTTQNKKGESSSFLDVSSLNTLVYDVVSILSKPLVAMTLFLLGIIFVIVASKQAKLVIDMLEYYGVDVKHDGIISNFLGVAVFLLVWFDILVFVRLKSLMRYLVGMATHVYDLLAEVLDEIANREYKKLKTVKGSRRR